jgi:hypothetical protein
MAVLDVTKKAAIYHTLYQLNSAFASIIDCYRTFRHAGVMDAESMRLHQGLAQEAQSDFNQEFLLALQDIETDDWGRFGQVRQAMEKRLRDPDDVFIHADERRAELAKERRKKPKTKKSVRKKPD